MAEVIKNCSFPIKQFLGKVIKIRKPETGDDISSFNTTETVVTEFLLKHINVIPDYDRLINAKLALVNKICYKKSKNIKVKTHNKNVPNTRQQYFEDLISKNSIHRLILKSIAYYYPDELKGCIKFRDLNKNIKNYKEGNLILITGINVYDKLSDKIINVLKDLVNKETLPLPIEKCISKVIKDTSKVPSV